jgi:hypothetical protein
MQGCTFNLALRQPALIHRDSPSGDYVLNLANYAERLVRLGTGVQGFQPNPASDGPHKRDRQGEVANSVAETFNFCTKLGLVKCNISLGVGRPINTDLTQIFIVTFSLYRVNLSTGSHGIAAHPQRLGAQILEADQARWKTTTSSKR